MQVGRRIRVGGSGWLAAVAAVLVAAGCGDDTAPRSAPAPMGRAPVQPAPVVTGPLPDVQVEHSPLTAAAPLAAGTLIDARILVISADGSESELEAIEQTLGYLGTPFDVFIASQRAALATSDLQSSSTHGKYNGIVLARGNLPLSDGTSAFSAAEFQTLANYEAAFQVRRASLYTSPDAGYGYSGSTSQDTSVTPLSTQCTSAGRAVFPYVNCASGVTISGAFAYRATASDASTVPLLTDASGRILAATRAYGDGREALSLTFAQAASLFHTLQLFHGVVSWVTRGVFLGERHAYIGVQVDDLFLASDIYTGGTYRINATDLQAALDWQNAQRAQTATSGMRYHWAFNGEGASASDALTVKAQQIGSGFNYISHTFDHADLDGETYSFALTELNKNINVANQFALRPFSVMNLVNPGYTGLTTGDVMQAMFDVGIRFCVGDTSVEGYDNPTPNAGIYNPLQPQILMIPRRPTNLFYNVSTPDQWTAEYNDIYRSFWGRDLSVAEILDNESDVLAQYLLKGENDPWMFHQADLRQYSAGHSLLGDLLDQTFAKYASRVTTPLISPTMDDLGQRVANRMRYNASGASGTVDPNAKTITVRASNAATVPVTGACGSNNEFYAGQPIAAVALQGGGSATLSLSNGACAGSGSAAVSTNASSYTTGATVTVSYSGLPGNAKDWIAIAPSGSDNTSYVAWVFTNGQVSGTATFTAPAAGTYVARAFVNNTFTLLAQSATFTTTAGASTVTTNQSSYTVGATVTVSYSGLPGNAKDWIAIAPSGSDNTSYVAWAFTNGQVSGTATFTAPAAGTYVARAFLNNTFTLLAQSATFTTTAGASTVTTSQSSYTVGATVTVSYSGLPGNAKDWLAIAPSGSANTSYVAWVFTNGQVSGTATFTAPAAGTYVARAFVNNTFTLLAQSATFTTAP